MADLSPDYNKRDCSLPPGCKDLIDVLNLRSGQGTGAMIVGPSAPSSMFPKQGMTMELKPAMLVRELAELLGQKPFKIIADLMELGLFANVGQTVDYDAAAKVLAKYGVIAKKSV